MSWGQWNIRMCKNIPNRPLHKLDRDGGLWDWATHRSHRSLTRLPTNAKSWKLCHLVEGTDTKKKRKCLHCNWHHAIVQLSNDYSVSSSTFTHVEAWALLPAWCVSAEVGPADMNSDVDVCWQLDGLAHDLTWVFTTPYAFSYIMLLNIWASLMTHAIFFLPLANFLVLSLNLTIPIVSKTNWCILFGSSLPLWKEVRRKI